MSRQFDVKQEEREAATRDLLRSILEFGLAGVVEMQGGVLRGFAIKYEEYSCGITIKAQFEGKWFVAFMYSDTMSNAIIAAYNALNRDATKWIPDKYQSSGS